MMQLFGFWRSLATYRVRIALNLKGIPIPETMIDLDRGEQDSPAFRRINPMGAVPALVLDDGTVLTQSMAILEWLDETDSLPKLLPGDPVARARARALCAITVADAHPLVVPRVQRYLGANWDEAARMDWNRHWFTRGLDAYEQQVGDRAFCCGEEPGLADICLASHIAGAQRFGVDLAPYPAVRRIDDACCSMPEFRRAHPLRQPGAPTPG
ncbi:MAG: maleylacetoacetate isomerase [Acetobacteraceae bacterium]|nr:maleylacetoacetate isomerase [Acetobacteraceae bacterium]